MTDQRAKPKAVSRSLQQRLIRRFARYFGSGLTLPLLILASWEVAIHARLLDSRLWASPGAVIVALIAQVKDGELFDDVAASLQRDLSGFVIGAVIGLSVGIVLARSRLIDGLLGPLLNGVKQIAIFAWVPLISIWCGHDEPAKIAFIALAVFFPVMLNTYDGVRGIDSRHFEVARVLGLNRWQRLRYVILPAAMPAIATGIRLALIYAWLATIGAEYFFASGAGIGSSMNDGREQFRMDLVLLGMTMIGGIGFLLNVVAGRLENWALQWRDG